MYKPLEDTSLTMVNTIEELNAMVTKLAKSSEIAIDLEHHDHRTYLGITCLMQISTRDEDWIVDTIVLRN